MSYDDIRFSGWDDPDENDETEDFEFSYEPGFDWDDPAIIGEEEVYFMPECECVMCGKERFVNPDGYCSACWQVWNG